MAPQKKEQLKRWGRIAFYTLLVGLTVFALVYWREELFALITSAQAREAYIQQMRNAGLSGFAIFLGLQVLQVVVAVIPGEPIEIMAGVLYGTLGGMLVCLLGVFLGSVLIYYFVKGIGINPLESEKHRKYAFLSDPRKAEMLMFVLFLVPGTPKDILLYFAPFLPIRPRNFFLLSTLARIPSVVSSTFAGANLAQGDFAVTALVFVIAGAAGALGILYNQKLLDWMDRRRARAEAAHEPHEKQS